MDIIKELEKAKTQIEEAIKCVEDGSLNSLLKYYQLESTRSISPVTHTIEEKTATMLNKIIKHTGFKIDTQKTKKSGIFMIFLGGHPVGELNLIRMRVENFMHFDKTINNNKIKIQKINKSIDILENENKKVKKWLDESYFIVKNLFERKKYNLYKSLPGENGLLEEQKKIHINEINALQKDIEDAEQVKEKLKIFVSTLKSLGFHLDKYLNRDEKTFKIMHNLRKEQDIFDERKNPTKDPAAFFVKDFVIVDMEYYPDGLDKENTKHYMENWEFVDEVFARFLKKCPEIKNAMVINTDGKKEKTDSDKIMENYLNGIDVKKIEFDYSDAHISFTQFGELNITGENIDMYKILDSKPMKALLGY